MKILKKASAREAFASYLFIMPNFLGFLAFTSLPVLASLVISFLHWDILTPAKPAGFSNFITLMKDQLFWKYVGNTVFLMAGIPIGMAGSLAPAPAMKPKLRGIVL